MTIEEIKELIQVVRDTGIAELEVQRGDNRVRIKGPHAVQEVSTSLHALPVAQPAGNGAVAVPATNGSTEPAPVAKKEDDRNIVVKSPIVGTYSGRPAFCEAG
jgi:acetyl-CoA carboxylase biotin carboxyl carrier protein